MRSTLDDAPRMRIGIVGGGFTGCVLAIQLLRQARRRLEITLIESREEIGRGVAYGTTDPDHFLNVRAANMSALPDHPDQFSAWLAAQGEQAPGAAFAPRMRYAEYVRDLFNETAAAAAPLATLTRVTARATALEPAKVPVVILDDARRIAFERLALCLGNPPSAEVPGLTAAARGSRRYIHDPWAPASLNRIGAEESVLVVGSGLSMADVLATLARRRHAGTIAAVSRHGLRPQAHRPARPYTITMTPTGLSGMVRFLRSAIRSARSDGFDWRDVVDAMRSWTTPAWQSLLPAEKARFLRHLRPYWDAHRHRLATPTEELLDTVCEKRGTSGFRLHAGAVRSVDWRDGALHVEIKPRGKKDTLVVAADWVVNCTGPQSDYAKVDDPFVSTAMAVGAIRPGPSRLGIDVAANCAVIGGDGRPSDSIFALGPPTRGAFWEITSVPDIRRQCFEAARTLLAQ